MNRQLYDNIIRAVSLTVKKALNESFIDDEDEITDIDINFDREVFSLYNLELLNKEYLIFLVADSLWYLFKYGENSELYNMIKLNQNYYYSYNLLEGYKPCKKFHIEEIKDKKLDIYMYFFIPINIDNIKNINEFVNYFYKTIFLNNIINVPNGEFYFKTLDKVSGDFSYKSIKPDRSMFYNIGLQLDVQKTKKNVLYDFVKLAKNICKSCNLDKHLLRKSKIEDFFKSNDSTLDPELEKMIIKMKSKYSLLSGFDNGSMTYDKDSNTLNIKLDNTKNVISFSRGMFTKIMENPVCNIKFYADVPIDILELRSGMSMENAGNWPWLRDFIKNFAPYIKNIPIKTLYINRVLLDNEGIELLKGFNVIDEIGFTESKLLHLHLFYNTGFRNPGCKITSDKKTFNKYIR